MSTQSLLAKLGLRLGTLGAAASLAMAAPLTEGNLSIDAHTDATRIGVYFDRTAAAEKMGFVVMGTERAAVTLTGLAVRGVNYSWPVAPAAGFLLSDGSGNLSWTAALTGVAWGTITGTLSAQTDLQTALNGKDTLGAAATVQTNLNSHAALTTAAHGGIVASTDPRLTDARTPLAHAASHAGGGSDPLLPANAVGILTNNGAGVLTWGPDTTDLTPAVILLPTTSARNVIQPSGAAIIPLTIKGFAAQSVNLQEWQTSAGTVVGSMSPAGSLTLAADSFINGIRIGRGTSGDSSNTVVGNGAFDAPGSATNNVALGYRAYRAANGGSYNVAIGWESLSLNAGGNQNTAVGMATLQNCTASNNTAIGADCSRAITTGTHNVAVGNRALLNNQTGDQNTMTGYEAGQVLASSYNSAYGFRALQNMVGGGIANSAMSKGAFQNLTSGNFNTAIGDQAGDGQLSFSSCTFLGANSDGSVNSLTNATAVGAGAIVTASNWMQLGDASVVRVRTDGAFYSTIDSNFHGVTVGSGISTNFQENTVVGYSALTLPDGGSLRFATAVGSRAMEVSVARGNTAVGYHALLVVSAGEWNTAIGVDAMEGNTGGSNNVAVGLSALSASGLSGRCSAVGVEALISAAHSDLISAFGYQAGYNQGGGYSSWANTYLGALADRTAGGDMENSTAIGYSAIVTQSDMIQLGNTSVTLVRTSGSIQADKDSTFNGVRVGRGEGDQNTNTVCGLNSLTSNTTGTQNTVFGQGNAPANTTGTNNTVFGSDSLISNVDGIQNVAIGSNCMTSCVDAQYNVAVGPEALNNNVSGEGNMALGYSALNVLTSKWNTGVGAFSGATITSGERNSFLGTFADASGDFTNCTAIGCQASVTASNTIQLGDTDVVLVQTSGVLSTGLYFRTNSPQSVTATATINRGRVKFTGSTAAQTLTLPAGVAGTDIFIRNAASVSVTIARAGGDTIEGATTYVLTAGNAIALTFVGSDWTIF